MPPSSMDTVLVREVEAYAVTKGAATGSSYLKLSRKLFSSDGKG